MRARLFLSPKLYDWARTSEVIRSDMGEIGRYLADKNNLVQ